MNKLVMTESIRLLSIFIWGAVISIFNITDSYLSTAAQAIGILVGIVTFFFVIFQIRHIYFCTKDKSLEYKRHKEQWDRDHREEGK